MGVIDDSMYKILYSEYPYCDDGCHKIFSLEMCFILEHESERLFLYFSDKIP